MTIFALVTSLVNSSLAILRISGGGAFRALEKLGVVGVGAGEVRFARIFDPDDDSLLDEVVVSYFKAPNSFTGEDVVEISCHASPYAVKRILAILGSFEGFRMAEAGEFSKIAFLNGKMDLVQAEAIVDLVESETHLQHRQALRQLSGDLGAIYDGWRDEVIELLALMESAIDFPDEDLPSSIISELKNRVFALKNAVSGHLNDNKRGQKLKDGLNLAIIGAPNVGKSSLLNFLAKSEAAIVSDIAGTTRDVIEVSLDIAGVPVRIADTAGIRDSEDLIEKEGVKRALKRAHDADLRLVMVAEGQNFGDFGEGSLKIRNKIDLGGEKGGEDVAISLKTGVGLDLLLEKLEEMVLGMVGSFENPLITQERYRLALNNAFLALEDFDLAKGVELAAEDLRLAAFEIAKITGKIGVDDILDVVFSRFCIGK